MTCLVNGDKMSDGEIPHERGSTMSLQSMNLYELVALRTTLLRGVVETKYSTPAERVAWRLKADAITEELTRRNESKR